MAGLGRIALAALGILAYRNRDKLAEILNRTPQGGPAGDTGNPIDKIVGSAGAGLRDLLDSFRKAGKSEEVDSWVGKGANRPLDPSAVKSAIDEETLASIERQTGMSRQEILERLAQDIPEAVNEMTPDGALTDKPDDLLDPVAPSDAPAGTDKRQTNID